MNYQKMQSILFSDFHYVFVSNVIQIYKTNLNKLKNTKTCPVFYLMIMLLIVSAFLDRPILLNGNKGVYVLKCHSRTTLKWNKACVVELLVDPEKIINVKHFLDKFL